MDVKLLSKKNIGVVSTLFLIILLTQSRVFDFLLNTYLGRLLLILFILGISYCHKIFGVIAILFIIIIFNQNFTFIEGLETSETSETSKIEQKLTSIKDSIDAIKSSISAKQSGDKTSTEQLADEISVSDTTAQSSGNPIYDKLAKALSENKNSTSSTTSTGNKMSSLKGLEGFNMIEREDRMLRGKQSNTIPVSNNNRISNNIDPSDITIFSSSYASV
jgi:hypothetical protein